MDTTDDKNEYSGKWWLAEIAAAEKELDQNWRTSADKVVDRYLDRRINDAYPRGTSKYNIFWANVQILKSALYATAPKPAVTRQYGDAKDDVARTSALILERILSFGVNQDDSDMHNSFKAAVEDRLIPGMGQVWLRYEADTEKYTVPPVVDPMSGQEMSPATEGERITAERVVVDHVNWRDFLWSPARTWDEVWWVGRRIWLKKSAFVRRWGDEKYKQLREAAMVSERVEGTMPKGFRKGKVEIYEVWCSESNKACWLSSALEEKLEEIDDPLQLDNFFPCPQPLLATHTTNDITPRPDYVMSQDQYTELDTLNDRISTLTKALRLVGAYDSEMSELKQMLTGSEFNMIPVSNWGMFAEKGGMKGVIDWFPIEQVANVLEKLMVQRAAVIGQIYELTSISDIMRGNSNPRETAKAQTLKAQYSSVRLQLTQQDVGIFVRHVMRIKAEIIAKHFQPQSIAEQSQIQYTESAQFAQPAIELIKNYKASQYRIEVSEESLSLADYNAERELRMEYVTAVGQFISQTAQMAQGMPTALPYILRILQWATAAFRGSSDIEAVFDEAVAAAQQPQQAPPAEQAPPDHSLEVAQIKAQTDMQIAEKNNQAALEKAQLDAQVKLQIAQQSTQQADVHKMLDSEEDGKFKALEAKLEALEDKLSKLAERPAEGD